MHDSQPVSELAVNVAGWVVSSGDNEGLPFAVVDKSAAQVLVFGGGGALKGMSPVLIGSAVGDHTAPGVEKLPLSKIPAEDQTTPAGRFLAAPGTALGGAAVLWVDYDSAVAIHAISGAPRAANRRKRLSSPTPDDNRVTHGCINVSDKFFDRVVRPTFAESGVVYVLPDTMALSEALPAFKPAEPPKKKRRFLFGGERKPSA